MVDEVSGSLEITDTTGTIHDVEWREPLGLDNAHLGTMKWRKVPTESWRKMEKGSVHWETESKRCVERPK